MNKKVAIILINYKDYAERFLDDCLASLARQDYQGEMKLFIVDNETSDKSFDYINKSVETINPPSPLYQGGGYEIIRNEKNNGFAKGNNDAIKIALSEGFEYIALFNMDTIVENNCVSEMVKAIEDNMDSRLRGNDKQENPPNPLYQGGNIGAVQARIMLYPDKEKINSLGNTTHFLGFGYCDNYGEEYNPPSPLYQGGIKICYPSGAGVMFTREALEKVGLFDEEFWMYNEDQDIGWRMWLAGYKCILANDAVVYHKYDFSRSVSKYYWLDRNRILVMLKNYHWVTLLLIFPAFIFMEFGLFLFSFMNGWFKEKIKVYKYFLSVKNWQYILGERKRIQKSRVISEKEIVRFFSGRIWYQEIGDWKLRLINPVFNLYWWVVKKIIFW